MIPQDYVFLSSSSRHIVRWFPHNEAPPLLGPEGFPFALKIAAKQLNVGTGQVPNCPVRTIAALLTLVQYRPRHMQQDNHERQ